MQIYSATDKINDQSPVMPAFCYGRLLLCQSPVMAVSCYDTLLLWQIQIFCYGSLLAWHLQSVMAVSCYGRHLLWQSPVMPFSVLPVSCYGSLLLFRSCYGSLLLCQSVSCYATRLLYIIYLYSYSKYNNWQLNVNVLDHVMPHTLWDITWSILHSSSNI